MAHLYVQNQIAEVQTVTSVHLFSPPFLTAESEAIWSIESLLNKLDVDVVGLANIYCLSPIAFALNG